ncbi:MAG TPA: tannase/feruloyl esterase family alpha/beta hydrolase [Steroidobacteraceae bacterium]|nr:tannase/feruloyl esterase family alpha/beta hydrolase [Steroidobacteraceae bacterium]
MKAALVASAGYSALGFVPSGSALAASALPAVCSQERLQEIFGSAAKVDTVTKVASDTQQAHCSVAGHIERDGRIGFTLGLPDRWNRKFLFVGVGGFAGKAAPLDVGLARGYATASTDTGHTGHSTNARWALGNPGAVRNYFEVAVEIAAATTKQATAAYYGSLPTHAYYDGCSGGGRQGLVEAQRFPDAFDGVISGAPAWNFTKVMAQFVENTKFIRQAPQNRIPPEVFSAIDREVLRQCDKVDGVIDGIIMDPPACKADLRKLLCKPNTTSSSCLSEVQLEVVTQLTQPNYAQPDSGFHGLVLTGTDGQDLGWYPWHFGPPPAFPGLELPADQSIAAQLGIEFIRNMVMNDPGYDWTQFTIAKDFITFDQVLGDLPNADDTNMNAFFRRGGKLLLWHGWADPGIPPGMSIELYDRIRRDTKGPLAEPVDASVKLFMVPGMQHCATGSGLTEFDRLSALEAWVERGEAPETILATQMTAGRPTRTRPLCPYPKVARFKDKGNPDTASSFECR